jgi:hypothetical protein
MDVIAVNDNIANVNPDTELNPLLLVSPHVLFCYVVLHFNSTTNGIYNASELNQEPITHRFHHAAAVFSNFWIDDRAA